jgi:8-oxo-dGTP diphosphatase
VIRETLARLSAESAVTYAPSVSLAFTTEEPPTDDVARAHVVAVTSAGDVVVCRSVEGWRFLPGGTREPGESVADLVRRELREEAGYVPVGEPVFLGRYVATSAAAGPYRPHLPHPVCSWGYYVVPVDRLGAPLNPADGEEVVEVRALAPAEAASWLAVHDPVHADVVRLAVARGFV